MVVTGELFGVNEENNGVGRVRRRMMIRTNGQSREMTNGIELRDTFPAY